MGAFLSVVNAVAAVVICLSLAYYFVAMGAGLHEVRRTGAKLAAQGTTRYEDPYLGDPENYHVYYLVPCLNEAAVVGATVTALRAGRRATTVVIDDASDDGTGAIAERAGDSGLVVVRRRLPDARKGKGPALNAGFALVRDLVAARGQDPARVIVCVMDADGRLSDGALAHVLPLFDDARVGGAQLAVRIRNREKNFLTRFQDFQFWSMSAVTQFGRGKTGTVSLGGNGQFTRLSALLELGDAPWSRSLTEDLDLSISLISNGWTLVTTPHASVDQQGVESLRRLIVQRRRWYQGHMTASRRLLAIWRDPDIPNARALEMTAYLGVPWIFDLPWSLLWHWTLVMFTTKIQSVFSFVDSWLSLAIGIGIWYTLTFAPALLATLVYLRRDARMGSGWAIAMGHSFLVMNYLSFICAWGALFRIVRGQTGWDKTKRLEEAPAPALAGQPR